MKVIFVSPVVALICFQPREYQFHFIARSVLCCLFLFVVGFCFFFNMARTVVWHVLVQSWQRLFLWPGEIRQ